MKKVGRIFAIVLCLILLSSFALSAEDDDAVDKAYGCLEEKTEECDSLSLREQAFTALATGDCLSEYRENSRNEEECWPDSGCRIKDTALAIFVLDRNNKDTDDAEEWLLEQTTSPKDLIWYLEIVIPSEEEADCELEYGNVKKTVTVQENHKISGSAGRCLSAAQDDYWLEIDEDCYETNFTISCDKNFKTTLLYQKKGSSTVYVSSRTNTASADGSTKETVNSLCFSTGSTCDYEGSLWATLALARTDNDVSKFLPYLIAMAEDNEKYFPYAFLYMIADYDEYFTEIINLHRNRYWKITSSPYSEFYDTALALMALYTDNAEQVDDTKDYLLEIQEDDGCWGSIEDTAFILYAAWPRGISLDGGGELDYCEDYGYYCVSPLDCESVDVLDNFECFGGKVCCRTADDEGTCFDKGGEICADDEDCDGSWVPASDTSNCCVGVCQIIEPTENECEEENPNYICRASCYDDEDEKIFDCPGGQKCCAPKPAPKRSYWWIWLLVILIILLILGIIFRSRLKIWLSKMKGKFGKGKKPPRRPGGFPPSQRMMRSRPRMIFPRQPRRPVRRRPPSKTDKELEDTLKKLKEMSK